MSRLGRLICVTTHSYTDEGSLSLLSEIGIQLWNAEAPALKQGDLRILKSEAENPQAGCRVQEAEREGDSSLDGQAHWKGGPSGWFESDVRAGRSGSAGPGVSHLPGGCESALSTRDIQSDVPLILLSGL